jgi:hypothetical protein
MNAQADPAAEETLRLTRELKGRRRSRIKLTKRAALRAEMVISPFDAIVMFAARVVQVQASCER